MAPKSPKPSYAQLPESPPTLRSELARPYIYVPLLLSSLLFLVSLWDQSRYTLSVLSPVLFLWSTILLPLPGWVHVLWLIARGAWGWYDSYRELIRITLYEGVTFVLLLPVLEDVRRAVRAVIPLLPVRAERKGIELRIVWGWTLAQVAKAAQWALGKVAGVSQVSGDAYRKALASEGQDRQGFLTARLDSIIRATTSLSLSNSTSIASPEDGPAPSPVKRKVGRPRRGTANPYSLAQPQLGPQQAYLSPPQSKAVAAGRKYRLPASPPPSDPEEIPVSSSASALEHLDAGLEVGPKVTPERRYPRRTKMSVDMGRTPEPAMLRDVKEEELDGSPVKRGRGRPRKNA